MSQLHLSDEILMAFADGELEDPVAATVEQAMLRDPAVTKRVVAFLRTRRLVRAASLKEATPDVPAELRAAIQAQIDRFESADPRGAASGLSEQGLLRGRVRWRVVAVAMAASLATIAIATAGYLAGRQGLWAQQATGPIAHLGDPQISHLLSETVSGQEQTLPAGRLRVISTYRMADGSLCREFKLQVPSGTADAVACRRDGWIVTFALASATMNSAYVPSDGSDLMAAYLQNAGAGQPLVDGAELKALGEDTR
jgi:hypothetical protein